MHHGLTYMYINFQPNRVGRPVKTVHTNVFVKNRKLHKIETTSSNFEQDAREAMRVVFSILTKLICMHKTKFLINIFKYCFKNCIKLHELANCNSANYDV